MKLNVASIVFSIFMLRASLDLPLSAFQLSFGSVQTSPGVFLNLLIVATVFTTFRFDGANLVPRVILYGWLPFFFWCVIEASRSPDTVGAVKVLFNYATYVAALFWGYRMCDLYAQKDMIRKIIIYSALIPIIFTPFQMAFFPYSSGGRAASTFAHPNIFAFYLMLTVSFCYFYIIRPPNRDTVNIWIIRFVFLLGMICIILTQTRSALIGVLIFIFGTTMFLRPRLLPIMVLSTCCAFLVPQVQDRFSEVLFGGADDALDVNTAAAIAEGKLQGGFSLDSFAWRKLMWSSAWDWIVQNPFAGYGLESFSTLSPQFFPLSTGAAAAHNIYVQLAFETGFIGVILYLAIFGLVFLRCVALHKSFRPQAVALFFVAFAYCVCAYSDNMLYYLSVNIYFWFLVGGLLVADPALSSSGNSFGRDQIDRANQPRRAVLL